MEGERLLPIKLKFQFCMFAGKVNHRLFRSFVNVIVERFSVVDSFLHMHIGLYKDKSVSLSSSRILVLSNKVICTFIVMLEISLHYVIKGYKKPANGSALWYLPKTGMSDLGRVALFSCGREEKALGVIFYLNFFYFISVCTYLPLSTYSISELIIVKMMGFDRDWC